MGDGGVKKLENQNQRYFNETNERGSYIKKEKLSISKKCNKNKKIAGYIFIGNYITRFTT